MGRIRNLFSREILFSGLNQAWRVVYGPVVLLFLPVFLSAEDQGFWFTFMSISALAIFADLGFNNIIMQFSAHEAAFVEFRDGTFTGDPVNIERQSTLFRFVSQWIIRVSLFSFPVIFLVGVFIFIQKDSFGHWLVPWILYLIGSVLNFISNSILSFFEGFRCLALVQKIRFISSVLYSTVLLSALYFHLGLFAIALSAVINSLVIFLMILRYFGPQIRALLAVSKGIAHSWKKDVLNLLWRYAISWGSGYLIFQIYTPFMFQFHGPVLAGKVGITIALVTTIYNIANVWVYTAGPKINMSVAKKDWHLLDRLFMKNTILSALTYCAGIIALIFSVLILTGRSAFIDNIIARFLPALPVVFICVGWFFQVFANAMAVYLRAHKQEPLVVVSIATGVYIILSTFLAAKFLPPGLFFIGFTSSYLWGLPVVAAIFMRKKKEWH